MAQSESGSSGLSGYYVEIRSNSDEVRIIRYDDGTSTELANASATIPENEWLRGEINHTASGEITFTLMDESGTELVSLSTVDTTYSSGGIGFKSVLSGGIWDDAKEVRSDQGDAKYVSQNHSVSNPKEAAINITQLSNVSVEGTVRTDGGTVLNQTTLTSTGNHTLALSSTSSEKLETVLDVNVTGDNPQFELADESILFENDAPLINNSSASPSGGEAVSDDDVTLSIDISDKQISSAQGEELEVEWYINGSKVDTTTGITTNGTVSTTIQNVDGGERQWSAKVTDSYGASTTSDTFSFRVPNRLAIRNVSAPNDRIKGSSVELTFYASNNVFLKNDSNSDGYIDLAGLDGDSKFIAVTEADGYYSRTVIIDSIFEQNSIYLLNKNKSAVEVRFTIDDPSGAFSSGEAEIFVEKALTRDFDGDGANETRVVRIASDEVGVNGFTTYLEEGARYRIKVRNKDSEVRYLGSFTADTAETVVLEPVPLALNFDNESHYNSTAYRRNTTGQTELVFEFGDAANNTTDLNVRIWEQGNTSHQPENWNNVSLAGPFGTYQASPALTENETNTIWVVNYTAQRGGEQISGQHVVGPQIQQQLGDVADWLLEAVAMIAIILTGALFSKANAGVGGVTTAMLGGGFWFAGWLSPQAGGGILLFLAIAIAYKFKGDLA
jgi:hypothetical protein